MSEGLTRKTALICDIDGTLADNSARIIHIKDPSGTVKKDWETYRHKAPDDKPFEWCIDVLHGLASLGHTIIFLTGRNQSESDITAQWLHKHLPQQLNSILYMRPNGDYRQDFVVKKEILERDILPHYKVLLALEDRRQCVDMYRGMGIVCLQCSDTE